MRKIQVTDEFMTELASRFDKARLDALPEPADCGEGFSPEFRERLIRRAKRRQTLIAFGRRAAAAVIALVMGAAILFAASPDVRAAVKGWVVSLGRTAVVYRVANGTERSDLPKYTLSYLPKEYEEVCRLPRFSGRTLIYAPPEGDHVVILSYSLRSENREIRIEYSRQETPEKVKIRALSGDYYPNSTAVVIQGSIRNFILRDYSGAKEIEQANTLVWFDESEEIIFVLVSDLEKDVMLHIARDVILEDPTK